MANSREQATNLLRWVRKLARSVFRREQPGTVTSGPTPSEPSSTPSSITKHGVRFIDRTGQGPAKAYSITTLYLDETD